MTVDTDANDAGVSSGMPSLSACFESIKTAVDENGPSEEDGEILEGEGAGEGDSEDASSTSQGNCDDDRSDRQPYYKYEDYMDAIGRVRTHLTTFLGEGALSEIVAHLDGFKDALADPEGDSPCTIFNSKCNLFTKIIKK